MGTTHFWKDGSRKMSAEKQPIKGAKVCIKKIQNKHRGVFNSATFKRHRLLFKRLTPMGRELNVNHSSLTVNCRFVILSVTRNG
ncbi:hypothetical protein Barb7_03070 [Bacteroidales bacterium Barb7]|nr:hypothetical protein Barb7_03070 [Bacteroidales bacterium Barb7]